MGCRGRAVERIYRRASGRGWRQQLSEILQACFSSARDSGRFDVRETETIKGIPGPSCVRGKHAEGITAEQRFQRWRGGVARYVPRFFRAKEGQLIADVNLFLPAKEVVAFHLVGVAEVL